MSATFILTLFLSAVSGAQRLTIIPDTPTTLIINSTKVKECRVCTGTRLSQQCGPSVLLNPNISVSVAFECPRPEVPFKVEIVRHIECNTVSCNGHIIQTDSGFLPLLSFNRTFTWNLKASAVRALKIDFTKTGLRQIHPSEKCADGHSYTLQASEATGSVTIGKYCRVGVISSAQILNGGSFSVVVPAGQKLQNGQFDVSVGEEIKTFAKMTLTFPKGTSSSELFSPNFPDSFPNDDEMEWYLQVPDKHKTSVQFLNVSQPRCLKKQTAVEYHSKGRTVLLQSLTEPKPEQNWGNVSLTLRNCDMDRKRSSSSGLSVNLRVSTLSTSSPVLCGVNMSEEEGLTLNIEKLKPASECKMKLNSEVKEKITVTSSGDLSFLDCLPEEIQVTATRLIECKQLKDCPKAPLPLLVPVLPSCLPAPLTSVTWTFRTPHDGTVELASPDGPLKQSLPGQPCNGSVLIKLTEGSSSSSPIGDFCPQGAIENVQIHANMSVTVSSMEAKPVRMSYKHVLNASFKEEISERYIFTVAAKKDTPFLLATPGWPAGMKGYSTVSWVVSVPPNLEAHLSFANLTQPKCSRSHTDISVQRVGRPPLLYSRREDEEAANELTVSDSFYLNMSNCRIEKGRFSVITQITLQVPKDKTLLAIVLSAVVALLVIVAVVACVVIKKKKTQSHQTSVYNPAGTTALPRHGGFPKTRADNGSHVYATIDDTLVYTHLLSDGAEISTSREFDSNRAAMGASSSTISKDTGDNVMEVGVYCPFQAPPLPDRPRSQALVGNEIYQVGNESEGRRLVNLGPRLEPDGGN